VFLIKGLAIPSVIRIKEELPQALRIGYGLKGRELVEMLGTKLAEF
jgi:hypothetical protein